MTTSDSETFESADEDFDVDQNSSSKACEKSLAGDSELVNTQKSGNEGHLVRSAGTEETKSVFLEDSLKSLKLDETTVQVKNELKSISSGDKSDSSESDGGGDSVRTLKAEVKTKQDSTDKKNEPDKENTPAKESLMSKEVSRDNVQTKSTSEEGPSTDSVRSNTRSRKYEQKRSRATREPKQTTAPKKLGMKITPRPVSPDSDHRKSNESLTSNNEGKEILHEDRLESMKELENLSGSATVASNTTLTASVTSKANEEKITSVLEKLAETTDGKESGGWGGWGSWGVSSLLSTATESVSTLTSQVTHGFSSVLETGIGIPQPEELARIDAERELSSNEKGSGTPPVSDEVQGERLQTEDKSTGQSQEGTGLFGFGRVFSGVSSITKLVESTGSKVITGGLDTLETIGKKTMEVLQEGDPGLRKKREIFSDKIILSQVLREAKEKAEMEDKLNEDKEEMRKAHFETLFDDYQGLVHLEALEMLSKQSELKVETILQSLTGQVAVELNDKMTALKELCEIPEENDDDEEDKEEESISSEWLKSLSESSNDIGVNVPVDKIANYWTETTQWFNDYAPEIRAQEVHHKAISSLARLTAVSVEQFHKTAELLLVKEERDPFQEAHCLQEMTLLLSGHIGLLATRFSNILTSHAEESPELTSISDIITNIFFEASNSSSYIKEAFQLIIPVLQLGVKP